MISRRLLRIKCLKSLYSYIQSDDEIAKNAEKTLLFSIGKSYDLYHLLLRLIVDVADIEEMIIEQRKKKLRPTEEDLNPIMHLVENRVINQLRYSPALNRHLKKNNLGWGIADDLLRKLHANMIEREYFQEYISLESPTYADDMKLVVSFYKNEIEDFEYIYEILDDMSIFWMDEIELVASSVIKTIKKFKYENVLEEKSNKDIPLLPLYKDTSDLIFAKKLVNESLSSYETNMPFIDKYTKNWDVDRLAFIDRILIHMALAEIKKFEDLPISITLNEYIELAKFYSTPQSSHFINGILDKMASDLQASGEVVKKCSKR